MTKFEGEPLSPLDAEIETLLTRLAALESQAPSEEERSIREIAVKAIKERLAELSRKCTDRTCRIRVIREARKAAEGA
jgi:hypothetical protein